MERTESNSFPLREPRQAARPSAFKRAWDRLGPPSKAALQVWLEECCTWLERIWVVTQWVRVEDRLQVLSWVLLVEGAVV